MRLAVVVLVVLAPALAQAKCMPATAFLTPGRGETLPPDPSIYLFSFGAMEEERALVWYVERRQSAMARFERLPTTDGPDAYRISFDARPGEHVVLEVRGRCRPLRAAYAIGPEAPPPGPVRVGWATRTSRRWSCSEDRTLDLALLEAAPAFRVEWAESRKALARGERRSAVVPGWSGGFFDWARQGPPPGETRWLRLGDLSCAGATLAWGEHPLYVSIVALSADGRAGPSTCPLLLEPPPRG